VRLVSTLPKREMSIGVTVNLQNYESLRIEVEDDVESEEDVRALITFLDDSLALFGRGDAATEKAVNHYRKRVLKGAIGEAAAIEAPGPADAPEPAPPAAPEPPAAPVTPAPGTPEPVVEERPEEAPAPSGKPATKASSKAAPKTPAKAPVPSPTGAVCESCGVPVSAAEEKTSRLFVSKVLCKKCIQSL